jgi:hypothetical protein
MPEHHISVRINPTTKGLMVRVAKARGESPSDFVRRAILTELGRLSYLDNETKKALGVVVNGSRSLTIAAGSDMDTFERQEGQ